MMAGLIPSFITSHTSTFIKAWIPQVTTYRHRYFADKKRLVRRYGWKDPLDPFGLLPRTESQDKVIAELPIYKPKDSWSERRALFGQNDYIDILGNDDLHPTQIAYNVPRWLRGVKGNELQVLIRKKKIWQRGIFPRARPTKWKMLSKRIHRLFFWMNHNTRTGYPRI